MIVRDALRGAKGPRKPAAAPDTLSGTHGHSPPARAPHPGTRQSVFWDAGSHPSLKFTAYLFSAKVASFFVRHFLVTGSHRATGPDGDAACEEEGGCHGCPRGRRPRERTVLRAGLGPRAPFLPLSGAQGLIRLKTTTARGDSSCTDKSARLTGPGWQGTRPGGDPASGRPGWQETGPAEFVLGTPWISFWSECTESRWESEPVEQRHPVRVCPLSHPAGHGLPGRTPAAFVGVAVLGAAAAEDTGAFRVRGRGIVSSAVAQ